MAKINRKIICDATFKKGAFKRLSDRSQLCYIKLCVNADDEGAILDFDGLMGYYRFEPEDLQPLIENNFFYHRQPDDYDEYLLVENFFEANNNIPSQGQNFTQSLVHDDIVRNFEMTRISKGGDGHYHPKKTPIEATVSKNQNNETADSKGGEGINNHDNGVDRESQYSENDFNENLFSDEELQAVIEECPKEYFDGDISSIEGALNECLLKERDGLTPKGVVMATHKYYNPDRKLTREGKFGKTLTLHEFLSDSTFVLAIFLNW